MRIRPFATAVGLALAGCILQAQEPGFVAGLKLRYGYGFTSRDQLLEHSQGVALMFGWQAGRNLWTIDLGYHHKAGDPFYVTPGDAVAGKLPVLRTGADAIQVGDRRRNTLEGIGLRFALQRGLAGTPWAWQAGLQFGGNRFSHEYEGDIRSESWTPNPTTGAVTANSWRDVYYGNTRKASWVPSPFVGAALKVSDASALELNLVLQTYEAVDYVHVSGGAADYPLVMGTPLAGAAKPVGLLAPENAFPLDRVERQRRFWPHVELSYAFRF